MGKLSTPVNFSTVSSWEELRRFVSNFCGDVFNQVNGKLTFADNLQGVTVDVAFTSPNVSVAVNHRLGYVPSGFLVVKNDSPAIIYNGGAIDTSTVMYLNASVATNATVRIF